MSYTHICILSATDIAHYGNPIIKKGDFCTLLETKEATILTGNIGYKFKEDMHCLYNTQLFLPIPPPIVKTQYVSVSEEVVKELPEPVLN